MLSRINAWLHLWLGLASGIIVLVVSVTGCILVFEDDIRSLTSPYLHARPMGDSLLLPPSALTAVAEKAMPGFEAGGITYFGYDRTAKVFFSSDSVVYVNPYTAEVAAIVDHEDFFHEVLEGHISLWLPRQTGTALVTYGTLVFAILLLTGLVLWWPKKWNRKQLKDALTVRFRASFKRVNYDLHNVPGFYTLPVALLIALTGVFMGARWFSSGTYWLFSGGKTMPARYAPPSDTTGTGNPVTVVDGIWQRAIHELSDGRSAHMIISFAHEPEEAVELYTNTEGAYYQQHHFDQYTGKKLQGAGTDVTPFRDANAGDQLRRLNYSLHVGSLWGIPSKIIYFIASLVAAGLPVTGFIIWWGKRKKKKGRGRKVNAGPRGKVSVEV